MTTIERFCSLVGTALLCSCLPFAVAYSRGVTVALPTQIDPSWWTLWTLVGIGLVAVASLSDRKQFYRCFLILAMACLTGLMVMLPYKGVEPITDTLIFGSVMSSALSLLLFVLFHYLEMGESDNQPVSRRA